LVEGKIEIDSYRRLKDSYVEELNELKVKSSEFSNFDTNMIKQIEFAFQVMENLRNLWDNNDLDGKRIFLSSIFPDKLIFENNQYRTLGKDTIINQFFQTTNELQSHKKEKVINFDDLSRSVARTGIEPVFHP
jgi:site-specific DNA recombinase